MFSIASILAGSSFWKSPRGSGRSSYAVGGRCDTVVAGVVVDDVVPIIVLFVVVETVVVVLVVVVGVVNPSAGHWESAGPASRHVSHVCYYYYYYYTNNNYYYMEAGFTRVNGLGP